MHSNWSQRSAGRTPPMRVRVNTNTLSHESHRAAGGFVSGFVVTRTSPPAFRPGMDGPESVDVTTSRRSSRKPFSGGDHAVASRGYREETGARSIRNVAAHRRARASSRELRMVAVETRRRWSLAGRVGRAENRRLSWPYILISLGRVNVGRSVGRRRRRPQSNGDSRARILSQARD